MLCCTLLPPAGLSGSAWERGKHSPHRECQTLHTSPRQPNQTSVVPHFHPPTRTSSQDWRKKKIRSISIIPANIPIPAHANDQEFSSHLLFPLLKVGFDHIHKVFWGSVSIARHIDQSERFPHCEEIQLFCVSLHNTIRETKCFSPNHRKINSRYEEKVSAKQLKVTTLTGVLETRTSTSGARENRARMREDLPTLLLPMKHTCRSTTHTYKHK